MSLRPQKLQVLGFKSTESKQTLAVGGPARITAGIAQPQDVLKLHIRIYGSALPAGNRQVLRCFLNRDAQVEGVVVNTVHDSVCDVSIPVPNKIATEELFHVWCYAERAMCGERQLRSASDSCAEQTKQINVMRFGFLAVPISRLRDTGMFGASLCDVDFVSVGSCDIWIDDKQFAKRTAILQDALKVGRQVQVFTYPGHSMSFDAQVVYTHETHPALQDTNITELGHRVFSTISSSAGQMPMWAFPFETFRAMRTQVPEAAAMCYLLRLLYAAEFCTGLKSGDKTATAAQTAELLNEFATVRSRACCYVLDSSLRQDGKEYSLDEWTFIADNPVPSLVAFDCEEGACDGIGSLSLLTAPALETAIAKHKGLAHLRAAQLQYTAVMAIVTLRMMATNRHSYHAIVLNIDAAWLQDHIESNGAAKLGDRKIHQSTSSSFSGLYQPATAMEFTMYATGCWQFDAENKERRSNATQVFRDSQLATPIPSNPKAPASLVQQVQLYGHVHTLFTPSLVESQGICQLICTYRGKLGVPIHAMMSGSRDNNIKLISLRIEGQSTLTGLDKQMNYMPRMMPLQEAPVAEIKRANSPSSTLSDRLVFDAVYRKADWVTGVIETAVRQHVSSHTPNNSIAITEVAVGHDMNIVRVEAWSS